MFKELPLEVKKKLVCIFCGKKILGFKDENSIKEYDLTGACQKCQSNKLRHVSSCSENGKDE